MTIVKVIKALYVKLGGSLTDTISGIADGAPVADYTVISDCIKALYVLYGGDLSEVYSAISDVAVKDYTSISKALAALAKVAFKGITVNESYDISEGTLNGATITLEGDITAHIPDGVTTISNNAFMNNEVINKVIMPNSVLSVADGYSAEHAFGAFINCSNLVSVILSNNLTKIASYMFRDNLKLESINIPNSVTTIGEEAFGSCKSLTSITIPDSVTSIDDNVFYKCTSLTDIYYTGTQAEWEQITIGADAIPAGATIHYEYIPET